jgi:hypothetical protein
MLLLKNLYIKNITAMLLKILPGATRYALRRSAFTLNILDLTPNHIELFAKFNPNHALTKVEYEFLLDLTLYELTIAEQVYIDEIKPSLNGSLYAY